MELVDTKPLTDLIAKIENVKSIDQSSEPINQIIKIWKCIHSIEKILNDENIVFNISSEPGHEISNEYNSFERREFFKSGEFSIPDKFDDPQRYGISRIIENIRKFESIFLAELNSKSFYFVPAIGTYNTDDLIHNASKDIDPSVFLKFDPMLKMEICEAGRALALNLPTASAFHSMRATEITIREYVRQFCGARAPQKNRNWGAYVRLLRAAASDKKKRKKPKLSTINTIDSLREHHRNPVIHPEAVIHSEEAKSTFEICKVTIGYIAEEIKIKRRKK